MSGLRVRACNKAQLVYISQYVHMCVSVTSPWSSNFTTRTTEEAFAVNPLVSYVCSYCVHLCMSSSCPNQRTFKLIYVSYGGACEGLRWWAQRGSGVPLYLNNHSKSALFDPLWTIQHDKVPSRVAKAKVRAALK